MSIDTETQRRSPDESAARSPSATASLVPGWVSRGDYGSFHRATAGFANARGMDILTFQRHVVEAYEAIFEQLEAAAAHAVRFWAFVPGIHDDLGGGLDRYMAFNAGRYAAFASRFGRPATFGSSVPTASAVGVPGDSFSLHCLGADVPGVPVENPRQISAYHYSRRFGPMPPCFARATLVRGTGHEPLLLVGGTASITGEESRHTGALEAQADETLRNLAAVVASAVGAAEPPSAAPVEPLLGLFRELRVYFTTPAHGEVLARLISPSLSSRCRVEWIHASLCRAELLVEIEGVALPAATTSAVPS